MSALLKRTKKGKGVFFRRTKKGIYPLWIGFWQDDGKRHETTLCQIKGNPPAKGQRGGDAAFERSRERAERLFERIREDGRCKDEEAAFIRKIYASRYGENVKRIMIADLPALWDGRPHKEGLTEGRRERAHYVLGRFVAFMAERYPDTKEAGALTTDQFKAYFAHVKASGVSGRTWNDHVTILRSVLADAGGMGEGFRNHLARLPLSQIKDVTIHRRPFSREELSAIFAAAREVDPELYPVIVAAACTALRRGDVAQLRWEDVNLANGIIRVKTSKTGKRVPIAIFPPLISVLQEAEKKRRRGVPFVFPEIAKAYKAGGDSLNRRLRKVLAAAGFVTPDKVDAGKYPAPATKKEAVEAVAAGMAAGRWSKARTEKGLAILQRHLKGETGKGIAAALGISRGAVSTYLHEMENVGRRALVSPAAADVPRKSTLAEFRDGEQRKHRGSLCGWHSFRTTFCTLALANGMAMEMLCKITGHRTTDIVLEYYDQRGEEDMRKAIGTYMPKEITGAIEGTTPKEGTAACSEPSESVVLDLGLSLAKRIDVVAKRKNMTFNEAVTFLVEKGLKTFK